MARNSGVVFGTGRECLHGSRYEVLCGDNRGGSTVEEKLSYCCWLVEAKAGRHGDCGTGAQS